MLFRSAFVSASPSKGSCVSTGRLVTCVLGTLAGGVAATVNINTLAIASGTFTNLAILTRDDAGSNPTVNTAELTTIVLPPVTISINDVSVWEGNIGFTEATFTLSLSVTSDRPVGVRLITGNGSATLRVDYVPTNLVVTIPPGAISQPVTVKVIGDTLIESNETFFVNLSSPSNATLARSQGTCTILDDDFKIAATTLNGSDVTISFTTQTNQTYRVERTEDLSGTAVWTTISGASSVPGNGSTVQILDPGGNARSQRFYRIKLNCPQLRVLSTSA